MCPIGERLTDSCNQKPFFQPNDHIDAKISQILRHLAKPQDETN
jgi:hypothetical protein